ncbi:MAG: glycosyltransferase [Planctomycetota bacterium]
MSHKVLILSYFFPPMGGAGTQRFAKFVKHLPSFGVTPVVITTRGVKNRFAPDGDNSLLQDIPKDVRVERIEEPTEGAFRDRVAAWMPNAIETAERVGREERVGAMIVTCSPFELAAAGETVGSKLGVPWVLDLRDPWALDGWMAYRTRWAWNAEMTRMRRAFASAERVIANTPDVCEAFRRAVPEVDPTKFMVITNGWDEEDFASPNRPERPPTLSNKFVIAHTGSFQSSALYPPTGPVAAAKALLRHRPEPIDVRGRTPYFLARALAQLRFDRPDISEAVRIVLVGRSDDATMRCFREAGAFDLVTSTGYLPHRESVGWLFEADALFLPLHGLPAGRRSLLVPGKTYEYLASGTPILGLLPEGDCRDWVTEAGNSAVAPPCDESRAASAVIQLVERWKAGEVQRDRPEIAARFERRQLTRRLTEVLSDIGISSASGISA